MAINMDRKALGSKIRQERLQLNFTQEQLAEYVGVSSTYIGFVERGERAVTLEKLVSIAGALHVSVDYLLSDSMDTLPEKDFHILRTLWSQASPAEQAMILDIARSVLHHSR